MLIAEASTLHVALPTWVVALLAAATLAGLLLLVALAVVFVLWATQDRRPREEE
jgi:TRAP-type C4-dicarboxylate transport system permease large subunit